MYCKSQFDSKWRVGGGWITKIVSQWELNYPISDTVGGWTTHLVSFHWPPGYQVSPPSKSKQVKKMIWRDFIGCHQSYFTPMPLHNISLHNHKINLEHLLLKFAD